VIETAGSGNWGIIGHRRAVGLLEQSLAAGRVNHAYLIGGPRQIGKTTLALTFAQALNCAKAQEAPGVGPCGQCRTCRLIAKGVHPDVHLLRLGGGENDAGGAESGRAGGRRRDDGAEKGRRGRAKNISIEDVRAMLRDVVLSPYEGRWKVYVIRYAEDLSIEGIQLLLKTLEEPPGQVVLILTTADAKILPLTVVSRCQQLSLGLVPTAEIQQALRSPRGADPEQAALLAHLCGGRVGWAIGALADQTVLEARARRLGEFLAQTTAGRVERLAYAEQLAAVFGREPESALAELELWLTWWRDVLLTQHGAGDRVTNLDRRRELKEQAARFQPAQLLGAMRAIRATLRQLQQNANPRLALEVLMLSVPSGAR